MLGSFKRHYLRGTYDIYKRYNKGDSWVVVTGGSDGIGLEICHQMAARGFNVCIVGRTQSKIEEKLRELEKYKIKTKYVVFDFASLVHIQDY